MKYSILVIFVIFIEYLDRIFYININYILIINRSAGIFNNVLKHIHTLQKIMSVVKDNDDERIHFDLRVLVDIYNDIDQNVFIIY